MVLQSWLNKSKDRVTSNPKPKMSEVKDGYSNVFQM